VAIGSLLCCVTEHHPESIKMEMEDEKRERERERDFSSVFHSIRSFKIKIKKVEVDGFRSKGH